MSIEYQINPRTFTLKEIAYFLVAQSCPNHIVAKLTEENVIDSQPIYYAFSRPEDMRDIFNNMDDYMYDYDDQEDCDDFLP